MQQHFQTNPEPNATRFDVSDAVVLKAAPDENVASSCEEALAQSQATLEIQTWLEEVANARYRRPLSGMTLVGALLLVPYVNARYFWDNVSFWNLFLSLSCSFGIPLTLLFRINQTQRAQQELSDDLKLGTLDLRWIPTLTQELNSPNRRMRAAASRLLTRLLPRLREYDATLLGPIQRRQLAFVLHAALPQDEPLIGAILKALERVGDVTDLPAVDNLAQHRAWLPHERRMRDAALSCISAVEARMEQQSREALASAPQTQATRAQTEQATGAVESSLAQLDEESKTRQPGMRSKFLIASWLTIVPYTGWQALAMAQQHEWLFASIYATFCGLSTQLYRFALSQEMADAARQLAAYDNVRGIGPLAEALEWPEPAIQEVAAMALTRLLPQLQATDSGLLSAKQRACLCRYLKMSHVYKHDKLMLAILKALEQIGDAQAVPYVKRLAASVALTPIQRKVKRAAEECLPFLNARADQTKASQMLLRASGLEDVGSGSTILLRPASSNEETEPLQLLRAAREESSR